MSVFEKKKEPEFVEPAPEPKNPVQAGEQQTNILVSDLDAFILDRVKSQPQTLQEIDVRTVEKQIEGRHRLSLPDELRDYEKKYAFCWIFKRKQAIDEACDVYHWILCNRTHFPDVLAKSPHLFTARGVIERGDEVLAFRTKEVDEIMRKAPGLESTARIKQQWEAHEGDATYYTPSPEYVKGPDGKLKEIPWGITRS